MEQWEIDLRSKLEKELPNGAYEIGDGDHIVAWTGKGGKIEYEVVLYKRINEIPLGPGLRKQLEEAGNKNYSKFNLDNFREEVYKLYAKETQRD